MIQLPTIGAFYQCYANPSAMLAVLKSFRAVYPDAAAAPVQMVSDGGWDFSKAAAGLGCEYRHEERIGSDAWPHLVGREPIIRYILRLCQAARDMSTDWVLLLEDDVSVRKPITQLDFDLNGINPDCGIGLGLTRFLAARNRSIRSADQPYGGCGGSIIRRSLLADWTDAGIRRACWECEAFPNRGWFSDYWITLLVLHAGGSVGQYPGFCETFHPDYDARLIAGSIEVLHQFKDYYLAPLGAWDRDVLGW